MAQALWDEASSLISVTEKHPFLVAMVDGTLPIENFQYYVIQDALYLKEFADCLNRLSNNDGVDPKDSELLKKFSRGAIEVEMALHGGFCKKWDIDASNSEAMPNTVLYTSYMIRIVATKCHAEGLAVLLPCFWVYMHVGKCMLKLREELGESVKRPPMYDAWIDMYAGDDFERDVKDYIAMCDTAAKNVDEGTLKNMREHFMMSCKLEHMFWDQANELMKWPDITGENLEGKK